MATAQIVGAASLSPIVGRLGDIFGRRNFILVGNALSIIGVIIAATAQSVNVVIGGCAIIGVASSMRQLAWSALGEIVPKRLRGVAFSMLQMSISIAPAFGPLIGKSRVHPRGLVLSRADIVYKLMPLLTTGPGDLSFGFLWDWTPQL